MPKFRQQTRVTVKPKNALKTLFRLMGYLKECKAIFIIAVISILVYSMAVIYASFLLKPVILIFEDVVSSGDARYAKLLYILTVMSLIYLLAVITNFLLNRLMVTVSSRVLLRIRTEIFAHMETLPLSYFDTHTHGEIMSLYTNDIEAVRELFQSAITQLIISTVSLVGIIVMMLVLSAYLTLIMVAMGVCVFFLMKFIGKRSGAYYKKQQEAVAATNGYIEEILSGEKVVKIFNREQAVESKFDELNDQYFTVAAKATAYSNSTAPAMNNLSHIFYAFTASVGAIILLSTNPSFVAAALIPFLGYINQFSQRMSQISEQYKFILMALAGAERLFSVYDAQSEFDNGSIELVKGVKRGDKTFEEADGECFGKTIKMAHTSN